MNFLPTMCYFPTTVAIVDDSETFLSVINLNLEPSTSRKLYNDPKKAFTEIVKQKPILNRLLTPIKQEELDLDENTDSVVNIDFSSLSKDIYNKNRFSQFSVVVVDYYMPKMNGVDFCRKLPKHLQKILITTKAEYKIAVEAFNEKLIDNFIVKDQDKLFKKINSAIQIAKQNYFEDIYGIKNIIGNFDSKEDSVLIRKEFISFFSKFYRKVKAVEFYLLDKRGSFLFLDANCNPTWLIIKNKKDLEDLYDVASYDKKLFKKALLSIKKRKLCPVFLKKADENIAPSKWKLFPLSPVLGTNDFYYACICEKNACDINFNKVVSYKSFLDKNNVTADLV